MSGMSGMLGMPGMWHVMKKLKDSTCKSAIDSLFVDKLTDVYSVVVKIEKEMAISKRTVKDHTETNSTNTLRLASRDLVISIHELVDGYEDGYIREMVYLFLVDNLSSIVSMYEIEQDPLFNCRVIDLIDLVLRYFPSYGDILDAYDDSPMKNRVPMMEPEKGKETLKQFRNSY